MVIAVPVGVAVALFITQYAPRLALPPGGQPGRPAGRGAVDRLRPLGRADLRRRVFGRSRSSSRTCSAGSRCSPTTGISGGSTIFFVGIVLAIMVLPIVTALSREVFAQTPVTHKEGALALGATRWEMIRTAVLPFGQPGVIRAVDARPRPRARRDHRRHDHRLHAGRRVRRGPGRCSTAARPSPRESPTTPPSSTRPQKTGAFIAAGLVLFVLTFIVNAIARIVIERRKAFSE